MAEPAIGRIGYVIDGDRVPRPDDDVRLPGRQVFCNGCRQWFATAPVCEHCGQPRPRFNKWLRHAQLDRHLYGMTASAEAEKRVITRVEASGSRAA